jgi:serine protease inhibitor
MKYKYKMLNYSIVLPAGSGKTTLSRKYEFFIDIDSLHTLDFREKLKIQYSKALKSGDWETYNNFECDWILLKLHQFPENYILLVHCSEKAKILNLEILGSFKPSYKTIQKVVEERGLERGKLTILNWKTTNDAIILETHEDIEKEILKCANKIRI